MNIVAINKLVKNKSTDFFKITHNFKNFFVDTKELAKNISKGHSFVCCKLKEENNTTHRKNESFVEANIFAIDIDNSEIVTNEDGVVFDKKNKILKKKSEKNYISYQDFLMNPFIQKNALLIYETPSSTQEWQRFRVLFRLPHTINNPEEYRKIVSAFIKKFGGDEACKDVARFFYGNTNCNPVIFDNTLTQEVVNETLKEYKEEESKNLTKFHFKIQETNITEIHQSNRDPNLLSPFNDYDTRGDTDTVALLIKHGWTLAYFKDGVSYLTRPGKSPKDGISASFNFQGGKYPSNRLFVFTSSTEFVPERSYTPYAVYTFLEHQGDFDKAVKALYNEGYGERMEKIIEKQIEQAKESNCLVVEKPNDTPQFFAEEFLKTQEPLYFIREEFYQFNGVCYHVIEKDVVKSKIQAFIKKVMISTKKGLSPLPANSKWINDILLNVALTQCREYQNNSVIGDALKGYNPKKLIILNNGILDLSFLKLLKHSPDYFSTISLKLDYNPKAECPNWMKFIDSQVEQSSQNLIQEWFGYNLLKDNIKQKYMVFYGLPGSGKSTALEILQELVGEGNYSAFTFAGMASDFGLSHYVNKQAIFSGDAHLSSLANDKYISVLERLKGITGNDLIEINRKGKSFISIQLPLKITFNINEIPRFNDKANALMRRLLVCKFPSIVAEKDQNENLKNVLKSELPGILNWALTGLESLESSTKFSFNDESLKSEFQDSNNPVQEFLNECCTVDKQASVSVKELYQSWIQFCEENGFKAGSSTSFGIALSSMGFKKFRLPKGVRCYFYEGIELLNGTTV